MFYKTKETVNQYIQMAKGYNGKSLIEKLIQYLPEGHVLELGSGSGNDIPILQQHYKLTASDFSPLFLEYIKTQYPNVEVKLIDAKSITLDCHYDGIYSNKVLQHLNEEELKVSLQSQKEILKDSGIICHSFWAGTGQDNFGNIIHKYYTKEELEQIISENYNILNIENYKEMEEQDSILVIAQVK